MPCGIAHHCPRRFRALCPGHNPDVAPGSQRSRFRNGEWPGQAKGREMFAGQWVLRFCARSVSSWRRKPVVNHRDGRIHVFGVWLPECQAETKSRIEKQGQSTLSRVLTGGGISDLRPEIRLSPAFTLHGSAATRRLTEINSAKLLASRRLRKCTASWPMRGLGSKTEFCGGRSFAQSHGILGSARAEHQRLFRS
jgi:hypothetical protein